MKFCGRLSWSVARLTDSARVSCCLLTCLVLLTARPATGQLPPIGAGATIARYAPAARPPTIWRVGEPSMTIGGSSDTGPASFVDIVGLFLLENSRLLVADGQSSELRLFALPTGHFERSFGGKGQGPGEISDLWTVWRTSTGVAAEDAVGKVTVFSMDGRYLRIIPRGVDDAARRVQRRGMFDDTLALASTDEEPAGLAVGAQAVSWIQLLAVTPSASRAVARYPHRMVTRSASGRLRADIFEAESVIGVVRNRACIGYPVRYVIDCYTSQGQHTLRIERAGVSARRVTAEHREDFFASETAANAGPRGAAYVAELRTATRFAESLPMFGEFREASNGDLWVGPYIPVGPIPMKRPYPQGLTTWSVFSGNGTWRADVQLPARFQLFAVRVDRVAGVIRDADDVEQVVVLPLLR